MTEIPADVMEKARNAFMKCASVGVFSEGKPQIGVAYRDHEAIEATARAIMAERERCLAECDNFINDIEIEIGRKKRFDIYDIQRQAKKSVRYVRDKISGEFEANWKTVEEDDEEPPK